MRHASTSRSAAILSAVLTLGAAMPTAAAAGDPKGIWLDDDGRGAIEIASCGKALCGKVVWVKSARDRHGCGKAILGDVKPAGSGRWDYGWIFDPARGRRFDVELTPVGANRLRVTGYAGIKLFSESRMWTRAPADLQRCDGEHAANSAGKDKAEPGTAVQTAKADIGAGTTGTNATAPDGGTASVAPRPAATDNDRPATRQPAIAPTETGADENSAAPAAGKDKAATADASNGAAETADEAVEDAPRRSGRNGGGLSIDKVLKKTSGGRCKLDLPWVKLEFGCEDL